MTLLELLDAVRDESLTKTQLEKYRDDLIHVHTKMCWELADIEKEEARFIYRKTDPETPDIKIKREWKATLKGQRQIELNRYLKGVVKEVDSLKSRLYNLF
jgi:hypothetical protein